ncbi:MAG TPA: DUF1353 domain-containing protein [Longimicrobium sp.]
MSNDLPAPLAPALMIEGLAGRRPAVSYDCDGSPRYRWRLDRTYLYHGRLCTIVIPEGFRFDLASVPRAVWWLIAPFELSIAAPLVHDFLYRYGGMLASGQVLIRSEADTLFAELMERERVPAWRRVLAYRAVRMFGRSSWKGV